MTVSIDKKQEQTDQIEEKTPLQLNQNSTTNLSIQIQNIPEELKRLSQWVCFEVKPEINKKTGKEELKKRPKNPHTGYNASCTNPKTWGTFNDAISGCQKHGLTHIGFAFTENDPYCGIDIDHCVESDKSLNDIAKEVIEFFPGTYLENSTSGTGIHLITKGTIPEAGRKNTEYGIEIYKNNRFFVCTGVILGNFPNPILDQQDPLNKFYEKHFKKEEPKREIFHQPALLFSDNEIIEKAKNAKNGSKFSSLYAGDTSYNNNDHSSADLALCKILAFYTKDHDQIDRIFRSSSLYREEKWGQREDYRNRTISKAIEMCPKSYDPNYSNKPNRTNDKAVNHGRINGLSKMTKDKLGAHQMSPTTISEQEIEQQQNLYEKIKPTEMIEIEIPREYNSCKIIFKKTVNKTIKETLKKRFQAYWNDDWTVPKKHKITVEAYLEKEGIDYTLEDVFERFHSLSEKEQRTERLDQFKFFVVKEGMKVLGTLQEYLQDYNSLYGTKLKVKDFNGKSIEEIKASLDNPKQVKHLDIIFEIYSKFNEKQKEERAIGEKLEAEEDKNQSIVRYGDFTVNDFGLYYDPENKKKDQKSTEQNEEPKKIWISSPIWPEAYLRDKEGESHTLLVKIYDGEREHKIAIPRKIILKWQDLSEILLDLGQDVPTSTVNQTHLKNFLMRTKPTKLMRCVNKCGWHGEQYIFPDGEIIGDAEKNEEVYPLNRDAPKGMRRSKGAHEDWLKHVWALCTNNSRLIFSVGVALASPCMYLTGEDSGGFNFVGNSSIGKSRCLEVAISVFGSPDFKRSWKNTSNGFEALCALHNDLLLPMDEGGQADPKEMGENIYMFSQGMGKGRMYKDTNARDSKDWRAMLLSTSEVRLSNLIKEGKKQPKAGQLIRIVDIPGAVKGKFGCFEELHGFENGDDGAAFAIKIREVCRQYYGSVGKEFIRSIIDHGLDSIKDDLKNISDDFSADVARNYDGQVKRVANRFGLVFAALSLAIKLKVLKGDVTEGMAKNAVEQCFQDWLNSRGTTGNMESHSLVQKVEGLLLENSEGKFIDTSDYNEHIKKDNKIRNSLWGCRDGSKFYVFCYAFTDYLCAGVELEEAKEVLIKAGMLDPDLAGGQKKINGVNTRCYLINLNGKNEP